MDAISIYKPAQQVELPTPGLRPASAGSTGAKAPQPAAPAPELPDLDVADQQREANVRRAAERANLYAVSDRRFTIFKDSTGQYITRFTSLRDGKVTYIPEPELMMYSSSLPGAAIRLSV